MESLARCSSHERQRGATVQYPHTITGAARHYPLLSNTVREAQRGIRPYREGSTRKAQGARNTARPKTTVLMLSER